MILPANSVKICSLRQPEHAEWVVAAGADLFGLIFAESRRQVRVREAKAIVRRASESAGPGRPLAVGVFVDQTADEVNRVADQVGLDLVQHHRPELLSPAARIERPVLLAYRTAPGVDATDIVKEVEEIREAGGQIAAVLIDGFKDGTHGGAGVLANWQIAAEVAIQVPVMLAGGLQAENVSAGISTVRPHGVDVSSGVEVDGIKDRERIAAFVRAAKQGFSGLVGNVDGVPLRETAEPVKRP
jgi:phosphoribosylanthranilate isomerase